MAAVLKAKQIPPRSGLARFVISFCGQTGPQRN
jgi:hypothetical protein